MSVRSVEEARAALAGGAAVVDVKEPARGSLGRAERTVIAAVAEMVAGSARPVPVSAALGELAEWTKGDEGLAAAVAAGLPVAYVKLGLAQAPSDWRTRLREVFAPLAPAQAIAVAYADHQAVAAPPVEAVLAWAVQAGAAGLLLDTVIKDGRGLFDHLEEARVGRIVAQAQAAGLRVALAGSLSGAQFARAARLRPDLLAVRGAACHGGRREGMVKAEAVRGLVATLEEAVRDRMG